MLQLSLFSLNLLAILLLCRRICCLPLEKYVDIRKYIGLIFVFLLNLVSITAIASNPKDVCYESEEDYMGIGDWDGDGVLDDVDTCPYVYDPGNYDLDGDGIGDICDNCSLVFNADQKDVDRDNVGDACDADIDGDLILNDRYSADTAADTGIDTAADTGTDTAADTGTDSDVDSDSSKQSIRDNCPLAFNLDQSDIDGDGEGDACDDDIDGDGVLNGADYCPFNKDISDEDLSIDRDDPSCSGDSDHDGINNFKDGKPFDNCAFIFNKKQEDLDNDGVGDACDDDIDGDGVNDSRDNCAMIDFIDALDAYNDTVDKKDEIELTPEEILYYIANPKQEDIDKNRVGDSCDVNFSKIDKDGKFMFEPCYVVLNDQGNCLKLTSKQLQVYSPGVTAVRTGVDPKRLRLFANHENKKLAYSWTLVGGDAKGIVINHPRGKVNCSISYEYRYPVTITGKKGESGYAVTDKSASFTTKLSGSYTLKLAVVELDSDGKAMKGDEHYSEINVTINSSGEDEYIANACGCSAVGSDTSDYKSVIFFILMLLMIPIIKQISRLKTLF